MQQQHSAPAQQRMGTMTAYRHNGDTLGLDVLCQWCGNLGSFIHTLLHIRGRLVNSFVD